MLKQYTSIGMQNTIMRRCITIIRTTLCIKMSVRSYEWNVHIRSEFEPCAMLSPALDEFHRHMLNYEKDDGYSKVLGALNHPDS